MATSIYIYSTESSPALEAGRSNLEDDLDEFLGDAGETTGGGGGGIGWNVDIIIHEGEDLNSWVGRLATFLRDWGVPNDTYFDVCPDDQAEDAPQRRVLVFSGPGL